MSGVQPPVIAEWFAESLVSDRALRDAALGDLAEDFAMMAESDGIGAARRWYWSQVLRSVFPLSMMSLRTAGAIGWLRLITSVVLGYGALAMMIVMSDSWLSSVATSVGMMSVASLCIGTIEAVVAGYLAAVIGGKAPMLAALALGLVCVSMSVLLFVYPLGINDAPLWYRIALMVVVLPACALGAMLRARQLRTGAKAGATISSMERE